MQIIRQAIFCELEQQILKFIKIRNKLIILTQQSLKIYSINSKNDKKQQTFLVQNKIIHDISVNKDYIALIYEDDLVEIRRLDGIHELVNQFFYDSFSRKFIFYYWSDDNFYLFYQKDQTYHQINVTTKTLKQCQYPFQFQRQQYLIGVEFCDIFPTVSNIIFVTNWALHFCVDNLRVGKIDFISQNYYVQQAIRLCYPFQESQFNRQFLAVLLVNRFNSSKNQYLLRIYNIAGMQLRFQKLFSNESIQIQKPKKNAHNTKKKKSKNNKISNNKQKQKQQISAWQKVYKTELSTDDLNEYLLITTSVNKDDKQQIISVNLLKIHPFFYLLQNTMQPFFLYNIELKLLKNLHLFPSHQEKICNIFYNSIDMAYAQQNKVFIVSLVVRATYRDDIFKVSSVMNQYSKIQQQYTHGIWKDIVEAKYHPEIIINRIIRSKQFDNSASKPLTNQVSKPSTSQANNQIKKSFKSRHIDIGIQQQQIIQSLLLSLNKLNNLNKIGQSQYQKLKSIIYVEYYPITSDINEIHKQNDINQRHKQNDDSLTKQVHDKIKGYESKTMSGVSKYFTNSQQSNLTKNINNCPQCHSLKDYQNLHLVQQICQQQTSQINNSLNNIQSKLIQMQTIGIYRLNKMLRKVQIDKKQTADIVKIIQDLSNNFMAQVTNKISFSLQNFVQTKLKNVRSQEDQLQQFRTKIKGKIQTYKRKFEEDKHNSKQILDLIYDMEFPD